MEYEQDNIHLDTPQSTFRGRKWKDEIHSFTSLVESFTILVTKLH